MLKFFVEGKQQRTFNLWKWSHVANNNVGSDSPERIYYPLRLTITYSNDERTFISGYEVSVEKEGVFAVFKGDDPS
jgi:hypothetical protein